MTPIDATSPNSNKTLFSIAQNTAKPMEVVIFAKNKETAERCMAICIAAIFEIPLAISVWYLFKIKIQFVYEQLRS